MYDVHFYDVDGFGVYEGLTERQKELAIVVVQAAGGVVTAVIATSKE